MEAFRLLNECFLLQKQKLGTDHPNTDSLLVALKKWETVSLAADP
jgi:hypothetical protein